MQPPLRVLLVVANPRELGAFDERRVVEEFEQAIHPLVDGSRIIPRTMLNPTENELRKLLSETSFEVVHFYGHAKERAAGYTTLAFLSSDGHARWISAQAAANLFAGDQSKARTVVLEACDQASSRFYVVEQEIATLGSHAIAVPFQGSARPTFLSTLYREICADLIPGGENLVLPRSAEPPAKPSATSRVEPEPEPATSYKDELRRKRAEGRYDVFLCHNTADQPMVKQIAHDLEKAGILPWLDIWELQPGQPWQAVLEKHLTGIRAAAVFVGPEGLGPWQQQEVYGFLQVFVDRRLPIIPVLLPTTLHKPELPFLLSNMTWVDFRRSDPNPLELLIWGITGVRPESLGAL